MNAKKMREDIIRQEKYTHRINGDYLTMKRTSVLFQKRGLISCMCPRQVFLNVLVSILGIKA